MCCKSERENAGGTAQVVTCDCEERAEVVSGDAWRRMTCVMTRRVGDGEEQACGRAKYVSRRSERRRLGIRAGENPR